MLKEAWLLVLSLQPLAFAPPSAERLLVTSLKQAQPCTRSTRSHHQGSSPGAPWRASQCMHLSPPRFLSLGRATYSWKRARQHGGRKERAANSIVDVAPTEKQFHRDQLQARRSSVHLRGVGCHGDVRGESAETFHSPPLWDPVQHPTIFSAAQLSLDQPGEAAGCGQKKTFEVFDVGRNKSGQSFSEDLWTWLVLWVLQPGSRWDMPPPPNPPNPPTTNWDSLSSSAAAHLEAKLQQEMSPQIERRARASGGRGTVKSLQVEKNVNDRERRSASFLNTLQGHARQNLLEPSASTPAAGASQADLHVTGRPRLAHLCLERIRSRMSTDHSLDFILGFTVRCGPFTQTGASVKTDLPKICAWRQSCFLSLQTIPWTSFLVSLSGVDLLHRQVCVPLTTICSQPTEFSTGGLQRSCRNISRMIS
nr:uncharacterized protein LOC133614899 [Nerophis lumbriciformis]